MNRIVKRILKAAGYGLLTLIGLLALAVGYVWLYSPGTTAPVTDEHGQPLPNSITELKQVKLNGTNQWILIRGYDRTKPVLLFVHGGPGSPELPMLTENAELEKRFVVVNWDQRGAGKSYDRAVFNRSFTLDTFVEDAAQLSRLLGKRFGRPGDGPAKIYIMGHSWGSFLAVRTVQKYPDLFEAYFGIGQVANQLVGEQISYDWVRQQARRHHNAGQLTLLDHYGRPPFRAVSVWNDYVLPQRNMVNEYGGGAMHNGNPYRFLLSKLLYCREYTLTDKFNYLIGAAASAQRLWPTIISTDLNQTAPVLRVPVYIFQGTHDYQTPYVVAKQYFNRLRAPQKAFFSFTRSAHGPIFEESALFLQHLDWAVAQDRTIASRHECLRAVNNQPAFGLKVE